MKELPISLRPANAEDVGFIFNAWLKSYKSSKFCENIPNEIYYAEHHKIIENLLKNYNVIVACNQEDPSQLYGFICAGNTGNVFTIHYAYVKYTFRKMGIGKAILKGFNHNPEYAAIYTHRTRICKKLEGKYNLIYHPYVAMENSSYKTEE